MGIRHYRPIEFRQVCAIARMVLLREPSMGDAEWKAATKEAGAKQGYGEPDAELLARALSAVERALKETMGARPVPQIGPPVAPSAPREDKSLTDREWKAFAATLKAIGARTAAVIPANVSPLARTTLELSEHAALDQFYHEAAGGDRIAVLRRFAELAIAREDGWDPAAVRVQSGEHLLHADACFGCRVDRRPLVWHHIIQIQHGGSNLMRNRTALCESCHADVHPWLPKALRVTPGWTGLVDIIPAALEIFGPHRKRA